MASGTASGPGSGEQGLPVLPVLGGTRSVGRDLARGRLGIALWGLPIVVILAASALTSAQVGIARWDETLYVVGAAWLGGTCLFNAQRSGRTHCWIVGVALPLLAVVGTASIAGLLTISWSSFGGAIWLSVIGAFCVEWFYGPYLRRRTPARVPA